MNRTHAIAKHPTTSRGYRRLRFKCGLLSAVLGLVAGAVPALPPPMLTLHVVPYVAKAPVIDGKLDDACWQSLPQYDTFYKYWTTAPTPTPLKTAFQLCYDDNGLYLAIRLFEKDMSKLKATITQRDDPNLWTDDCVEIYIDSTGTARGYRNYTLNALATKADRYQMDAANNDQAWSPDGWQAATGRDANAWYLEVFYPWSDVGAIAKEGDLWRFCICRFAWSAGNQLATSTIGGNYNAPDRFAWLLFLKSQDGNMDALTRQLAARVSGDWLLPLQDKVVEKIGGKVSVSSMPTILAGLRQEVDVQQAECKKLFGSAFVGTNSCETVMRPLSATVIDTRDPVVFQQSVLTISAVSKQLKDLKYTYLLTNLISSATSGTK